MKRLIALAFVGLIVLAGCTNGATTPYTETTTASPAAPQEYTIEQLGATIVAAGEFWEDWWNMRGPFAHEHIEELPWEDTPEHLLRFSRFLPSSGFESLADIRAHLLQYYTEAWVDAALAGEFSAFVEYDGLLYVDTTRAGFSRSNWETATHTLVEQEGGRAVVETTVMHGAWHRIPYEPDIEASPVQYTFTFVGGRIDQVESPVH